MKNKISYLQKTARNSWLYFFITFLTWQNTALAAPFVDPGPGNAGNGCDPANPFGCVTPPVPGGGLIPLLSNVLRLIFVVAGVYAFLRIVLAGLAFIGAAGDPKKIEQAWNSIWQSLLGLVIIISSFALAALAGQILFNDPTAILNPKVYGPGTSP